MTGLKRFFMTTASAAVLATAAVVGTASAGQIDTLVLTHTNSSDSFNLLAAPVTHLFGGAPTVANTSFSGSSAPFIGASASGDVFTLTATGTVDPGESWVITWALTGFADLKAIFGTFSNVFTIDGSETTTQFVSTISLPVIPLSPGFDGIYSSLNFEGSLTPAPVAPVPIPAAAVLFGSGLIGMLGMSKLARRRREDETAV